MSSEAIHARVSAVNELNHGLATYAKSLAAALSSARGDVNRAGGELQLVVADSQQKLRAAQRRTEMAAAALAACSEGCASLAQELAAARVAQQDAERRLERNRQAQARFERAWNELRPTMVAVEASAAEIVPAGRKYIREYAEILTDYLKTGV
jgi:chromosome segregation ATPase